MIIAVDVDEVLADFANPLNEFVKKKYGLVMDQAKWNTDNWWQAWGGTKTTAVSKIYEFVQTNGLDDLPLIPGAVDGVKRLKEMGHELIIITGRAADWMDMTNNWLDKYFPGVFTRVESTDFHVVRGGQKTKGRLAKEFKCEMLIDDFPHYAEEAINNGIKVLLFDTGFNHNYKEHDGIYRVKDWDDVVSTVKRLSRK